MNDDVEITPWLAARLEYLRSAVCSRCSARLELHDGMCWECFRAATRETTNGDLSNHAPRVKVGPEALAAEREKLLRMTQSGGLPVYPPDFMRSQTKWRLP